MTDLVQAQCQSCNQDTPRLTDSELEQLLPQLPQWHIELRSDIKQLEKTFRFNNFVNALSFTNRVGDLAEQENHHPSLLTEWGKVTVTWWSHNIKGLHKNDLILAARTEQLYNTEQDGYLTTAD